MGDGKKDRFIRSVGLIGPVKFALLVSYENFTG
jgi:hypothetical protein